MNTGTIMLVEDEPAQRGLIQRILVAAGYEVLEARNGAEALDNYRPDGIDLLITDVRMPCVDGVSLVQRLRAQGEEPRLLVISARPLPGDLPPDGAFLPKPFTREDLLEQVRLLIRRPAPDTPSEG